MSVQDATDVEEGTLPATSAPTPPALFDDGPETRHWALVDGEHGPVHIGSPGPFPPAESLCRYRHNGTQWSNSRLWSLPTDRAPIGVCMDCWESLDKAPNKPRTSSPGSTDR